MVPQSVDQMASRLARMDRDGLVRTLRQMRCNFNLDFTEEFLASISVERLRHITLAAALHDANSKLGA